MPLFKRPSILQSFEKSQARLQKQRQMIAKFDSANKPKLRRSRKAITATAKKKDKLASQEIKLLQKSSKKRFPAMLRAKKALKIARISSKLRQAKGSWFFSRIRRKYWLKQLEKQFAVRSAARKINLLNREKQATQARKTAGLNLAKAKFAVKRAKLAEKRRVAQKQLTGLKRQIRKSDQEIKVGLIRKIIKLQYANVGLPITDERGLTIARLDETPFKAWQNFLLKIKKPEDLMAFQNALAASEIQFRKGNIRKGLQKMGLGLNDIELPADLPTAVRPRIQKRQLAKV